MARNVLLKLAVLRYFLRNRDLFENAILVLVLPFVAGSVNASGFMLLGVYTSHVTGLVARFGDELAQNRIGSAFSAVALVVTFFFGAMTATAMVEKAKRRHRARYSVPLLVESGTLVVVLVLCEPHGLEVPVLATMLLSFAMGTQNALVTKLSGAVVRTTHLTGIVTDIGIETVRVVTWFGELTRGQSIPARVVHVWRVRRHRELERLRLHLAIFGSFLSGAVMGPFLYVHSGRAAIALPILVLVALVLFDSVIGFRDSQQRTFTTPPPDLEHA